MVKKINGEKSNACIKGEVSKKSLTFEVQGNKGETLLSGAKNLTSKGNATFYNVGYDGNVKVKYDVKVVGDAVNIYDFDEVVVRINPKGNVVSIELAYDGYYTRVDGQ